MITLMRFVNFVVVMGLAALPVWQFLEPKCFAQVWEQARGPVHYYLLPAAAVIIALNLIAIVLWLGHKFSRRPDIEIISNDEPTVISSAAVEKRLLELASKFPGVRQTKIALEIRGREKPIICNLSFGLACETDITGRIDEVKKCLRDAFNRLLPGASGIEIKTKVFDLRAEEKLPETAAKREAPAYDGDFSGPLYPASEHHEGVN
ncbi:MAG: hypothetical protein LBP75_04240 [Planctomycetota bacterium]|nr:hypothetical protein [Planctomycetota bacterium]